MPDRRAMEIGSSSHPRLSLVIDERVSVEGNLSRLALRSSPTLFSFMVHFWWCCFCEEKLAGFCWSLRDTQVRRRKMERRKGKAWGFFKNNFSEERSVDVWVCAWKGGLLLLSVEIGNWWFPAPPLEYELRRGFIFSLSSLAWSIFLNPDWLIPLFSLYTICCSETETETACCWFCVAQWISSASLLRKHRMGRTRLTRSTTFCYV